MAQIVYRGNTYPVIDPVEWYLGEASFIRRQTGQAVGEIGANAALSDAEAIVALLYVAKKRAGEKVRWEDFHDFTVGECDFIQDGKASADESGAGEGGADPTSPSGTTPATGSSTTSTRSRSTSGSTRGKSKS